MRDVQAMISLSEANGELNYKGVALVMRAWMFYMATDCYGDIPYSEATQAKSDGIYYPKYDTQEEIYNGILSDLEEANTLLQDVLNVKGDLIYGGDVAKWRKLANSLRIRYLMRISDRVNVSSALEAIVNDPSNFPVFEG